MKYDLNPDDELCPICNDIPWTHHCSYCGLEACDGCWNHGGIEQFGKHTLLEYCHDCWYDPDLFDDLVGHKIHRLVQAKEVRERIEGMKPC
jgi:hypothetical protein